MKKKQFLVLFFVSFLSINSYAAKKSSLPQWVNDVKSECDDDEICAVGSGPSAEFARNDARNNLQKIFEVKIDNTFTGKTSTENNVSKESTSDRLSSSTSGILKGVEIEKTYENNGVFYALASLEKEKVSRELEMKINNLDERMQVLLKEKKMSSTKKAEEMLKEREKLNEKYLFVTGREVPNVVNYSNISDTKIENRVKTRSYYVDVDGDGDDDLEDLIESILTDNGGAIMEKPSEAMYVIKGTVKKKKQYLNIEGFEKYTITFNINILKNGKIIQNINKKITESGGNYEQVYSFALEEISEFLNDNLMDYIN